MMKKKKSIKILIVLLLFGSMLVTQIRVQQLRSGERVRDRIFLVPSIPALKVMSLGFKSLVADILWLRSIQYFGGWYSQMNKQPQGFIHLMDAIVALDPRFISAYEFGSFGISEGLGNFDAAVDLLVRGAEMNKDNPEAWRLMYDAGFIRFYNQQMYDEAKELISRASKMPSADPFVERTIAYIDSVAGRLGLAKAKYLQIYQDPDNTDAVKQIAYKHLLRIDRQERTEKLRQVIDLFEKETGARPDDMQELVSKGYLSEYPTDMEGSQFFYVPEKDRIITMGQVEFHRQEIRNYLKQQISIFEMQFDRLPENLDEIRKQRLLPEEPEDLLNATIEFDPESNDIIFSATGE